VGKVTPSWYNVASNYFRRKLMSKRIVVGVHVDSRVKKVPHVQEVFTKYGCNIKTRLGLHEVADNACSPSGLIILEMYGDENAVTGMESELNAMDGVTVKKMEFGE
jgi:hypothetical protein